MSLPPRFLEDLRDRVVLSDVISRHVTWDKRRSNAARGDHWAPCPFHHEKTSSFHVDDRKGFYKCFGCDASGDAIKFLREQEGMSFMEAVERLAGMVGLEMPAPDPVARARETRRRALADIMELAVGYFRAALGQSTGVAARAELERRGLDRAVCERFEIGFAPERGGLQAALLGQGVSPSELERCGLTARPDDGRNPYERFRDRIIFPIRDAKGRCIGFGGRAMSAEARAKYLNSPETELFDKGRSLYNIAPAREAVAKGASLVVAEGYMDVIALVRGGFPGAVAPLGTAITETQLAMLWKMSSEPVIALDGDAAGARAAMRLAELALPQLAPDRTLRFCLLPAGQDPDDILRTHGASGLQAVLAEPLPLVDLLWQRAVDAGPLDTPEQRAAFEQGLDDITARITHAGLQRHYRQEFRNRSWQLLRGRQGQSWSRARPARNFDPQTAAKEKFYESLLLALMISHPSLALTYAEDIAALHLSGAEKDAARREILSVLSVGNDIPARLREVQTLTPALRVCHGLRPGDNAALARLTFEDTLTKLVAFDALAFEVAEAEAALEDDSDAAVMHRLHQAKKMLWKSFSTTEDETGEAVAAPNGAKIDQGESAALDSVLASITFEKTPRAGR